MTETFTKLFSSITKSSIWLEDHETLRVWVTMLALADRNGYVGASVGGLASTARVDREKTREALEKFLAPDPDSRSADYDGRRIELADRGWNILNYQRFRDMRDEESRREYFREQKRKSRAKAKAALSEAGDGETKRVQGHSLTPLTIPDKVDCPALSTHAEAEAEAEAWRKHVSGVNIEVCPLDGKPWGDVGAERDQRDVHSFDAVNGHHDF